MSILEEFFYEGMIPISQPVSDHEEYAQTIAEVSRLKCQLQERLSGEYGGGEHGDGFSVR